MGLVGHSAMEHVQQKGGMGAWRSRRPSLKSIPGQSPGRMNTVAITDGDGRNGAEIRLHVEELQGGHPKIGCEGHASMEDCALALAP